MATVFGIAAEQVIKEKKRAAVLRQRRRVSGVDGKMPVEIAEPAAILHTVVSGDKLSKIAQQHHGDANKYLANIEANKPMPGIRTRSTRAGCCAFRRSDPYACPPSASDADACSTRYIEI